MPIQTLIKQKTLAELKRDLFVGRKITLISAPDNPKNEKLNLTRFIISTQSNGVTLALNRDDKKDSFLELPKATLLEYVDDEITIYNAGKRALTPQEQAILDHAPSKLPENKEQAERDLLCDGSTTYWLDKRYFQEKKANYLKGMSMENGMRFNFHDKNITDESIKGTISLIYSLE